MGLSSFLALVLLQVVIERTIWVAKFSWGEFESLRLSLENISLLVASSNLNLVKRVFSFSSSSSVQGTASRYFKQEETPLSNFMLADTYRKERPLNRSQQ